MFFLDDLPEECLSEWQKDVIYRIVDYRYENRMPMVLTSNLSLADIREEWGPRTHSRLSSSANFIINMGIPDKRLTLG